MYMQNTDTQLYVNRQKDSKKEMAKSETTNSQNVPGRCLGNIMKYIFDLL